MECGILHNLAKTVFHPNRFRYHCLQNVNPIIAYYSNIRRLHHNYLPDLPLIFLMVLLCRI